MFGEETVSTWASHVLWGWPPRPWMKTILRGQRLSRAALEIRGGEHFAFGNGRSAACKRVKPMRRISPVASMIDAERGLGSWKGEAAGRVQFLSLLLDHHSLKRPTRLRGREGAPRRSSMFAGDFFHGVDLLFIHLLAAEYVVIWLASDAGHSRPG